MLAGYGLETTKIIGPKALSKAGGLGVNGLLSFMLKELCEIRIESGWRAIWRFAHVAQSVERVLGKDEVISSILIMGSR